MSTSETDLGRDLDSEARRRIEEPEIDHHEPQSLERDIDATRADMRATLEALERRLSLDRMIELTVGRIRERGGEFAGNLTDAATQNPMPLLLASIGVGWMMLATRGGRRSASAADGESRIAAAAHKQMDHARQGLHDVRERVEHARERMDHARERVDRLLDEQPLMLGALGLAAGAIIGALLPSTEAEDRWIGDVSDKAVRNVAHASRAKYEAAREQATAYSAPGSSGGEQDSGSSPSRPH
jgi:ElaB/YqjD/DUF883 family membrane-anchored ribosome-binding protein